MVSIKKYYLEQKAVYYVRSKEESYCPYCGGKFKVIGSRKRILFMQDGSNSWLIIRRLECIECNKISHELPDCIIPYKRYEARAIENEILEREECIEKCICPVEQYTIYRWRKWFLELCACLQNQLCFSAIVGSSAVGGDAQQCPIWEKGWLSRVVYELVNSNKWLITGSV